MAGKKTNKSRGDAVKTLLAQRKARFATIAFVDLNGQLRGKTVAAGHPGRASCRNNQTRRAKETDLLDCGNA